MTPEFDMSFLWPDLLWLLLFIPILIAAYIIASWISVTRVSP